MSQAEKYSMTTTLDFKQTTVQQKYKSQNVAKQFFFVFFTANSSNKANSHTLKTNNVLNIESNYMMLVINLAFFRNITNHYIP
jgi:hypothetical protein